MPEEFIEAEPVRVWLNHLSAMSAAVFGVRSLYSPRFPPAWLWPAGSRNALSLYDSKPLRDVLARYVDFDRINAGPMRFSVGAVNIRTGNFDYFDSVSHEIRIDHILASAALPPMLPPVEIDGDLYWDGGLVSNTPLQWVAEAEPQRDTLVFQVDLWNTRGPRPSDLAEVVTRQKEIQYASRTRAGVNTFRRLQRLQNLVSEAIKELPPEVRGLAPLRRLEHAALRKVFRIVHLIYHAQPHQGTTKDFEFSRLSIDEHWARGHSDATRSLRHPEALARPDLDTEEGVATFDIAVDGRL
jgi:NTE family protein